MKQRKNRKNEVLVVRIVKNSFILFLAVLSVLYTKSKKSDRVKEYSKNIIPALVTWGSIGIIILICTITIGTKLNSYPEAPTPSTNSSKSEYIVDQAALDEATAKYEEEQRQKAESEFENTLPNTAKLVENDSSTETDTTQEENEEDSRENKDEEQQASPKANHYLTEAEISMLCQAVQHETGYDPSFYICGDFDTVQQYMAASIINRIGQPGFGVDYTTPNSLYDVLANSVQYGNMLWELSQFNAYDERTRINVSAVLNGTANVPAYLYFERCSYVGEDYCSAKNSFYEQYGYDSTIQVAYMSQTIEGRFIIFATNVNGAYAN